MKCDHCGMTIEFQEPQPATRVARWQRALQFLRQRETGRLYQV